MYYVDQYGSIVAHNHDLEDDYATDYGTRAAHHLATVKPARLQQALNDWGLLTLGTGLNEILAADGWTNVGDSDGSLWRRTSTTDDGRAVYECGNTRYESIKHLDVPLTSGQIVQVHVLSIDGTTDLAVAATADVQDPFSDWDSEELGERAEDAPEVLRAVAEELDQRRQHMNAATEATLPDFLAAVTAELTIRMVEQDLQ